jgi:alpha-beta hydrolase superfamily lysophospholipase
MVAAATLAAWSAASEWSRASPRRVGPAPAALEARDIGLTSSSGHRLRGWLADGSGIGGVVLVHGVRETRRAMLGRALFLHRAGYAVLLFDLSAHGESEGDRVELGLGEAADVRAAVDALRAAEPGEPIAALGFSLGGAACVLGSEPLPVDGLGLEAVYPDIETAVANRLRMRFGAAGGWLAPLLTMQLEPRWHIAPSALRPVEAIARVQVPVLVVAGGDDARTTPGDAARLFAAAREPKELWVVPGAGHADFHRAAPAEYEARVLAFLSRAFAAAQRR